MVEDAFSRLESLIGQPAPHSGSISPLSATAARALDARAASEFGLSGLVLMEHASRGLADLAGALLPPGEHALIVAGPGGNGGDGYGMARWLARRGHACRMLDATARAPRPGDAAIERALAARVCPLIAPASAAEVEAALDAEIASEPALIVDALFGIGVVKALRPPYPALIERINAAESLRLSVDIPSGMHADDGVALPVCVQAHVTATMVAPKVGFAPGAAGARAAGHVVTIDIGLPP